MSQEEPGGATRKALKFSHSGRLRGLFIFMLASVSVFWCSFGLFGKFLFILGSLLCVFSLFWQVV
jgi:hypothetical protein